MCVIISSDFSRDSHTYLNGKSKIGIPRGNPGARYNHPARGGLKYTIRPSYEMRISVSSMRNVTLLVCKRGHTAALSEQSLIKVVVEGYGYGVERHSQQFFIYIVVVSFCFWLRTFEDIWRPEKITHLPQFADKLYHICCIEYTSSYAGFELTTLVAINDTFLNIASPERYVLHMQVLLEYWYMYPVYNGNFTKW